MTIRESPKYQTDYTYSKECPSCGAYTRLGTEHGQFWKPGVFIRFICTDCGDSVTSFIYRHKK